MLQHVLLQPCTFGGPIKWYESSDNARNLLDQFHVVDEFINWEDSDLYCDHCGREIEPCYRED